MTSDQLVLAVYLITIVFIIFFSIIQTRKIHNSYFLTLINMLGVDKFNFALNAPLQNTPGYSFYVVGKYQERVITCTALSHYCVFINTVPKIVPKKIPWHSQGSLIYKDYELTNRWGVSIKINFKNRKKVPLSKEESKSILDELVYACDLVEKGEYKV